MVAHCPQFSFHGVIQRRETIQLKGQQKARLEGTVVCHFPAMTANLVTMRRNASEKITVYVMKDQFIFFFPLVADEKNGEFIIFLELLKS